MRALALLAAAGLAGPAAAQYSFTLNYTLDEYQQVAAAAEMCSPGHAAFLQLDYAGGVDLGSTNYQVDVGFLGIFDPGATKAPLIFDISPALGFMDDPTAVTIGGKNFVLGGDAGPLTLDVGGVVVGDLNVVSDTQLTGTIAAGTSGPKDVTVTSQIGTGTEVDGFVHTPGLWLPETFPLGTVTEMRNYGPVAASFDTWVSTNQTSFPLPPFGTVEIGPAPIFNVVSGQLYPAPDGINTISTLVPDNPGLIGNQLHFQSVAVLSLFPLDVRLTNSRSIVYE